MAAGRADGSLRCIHPALWLVAVWAALAAAFPVTLATPARAQEKPAADAAAGDNAAPAAAPAAADDAAKTGETKPRERVLMWLIKSLGWHYTVIFLGLSFALVALIVMNILCARRENVCPTELVESFEVQLNEKKYQEAYELAKHDESFLGRVLSAGLERLGAGYPQAVEAMQEVGEEENMKLDHRLSYMALIGTISPMFGLLGTVEGMIRTFIEIATAGATPKPQELAKGISMALVTTLVGLMLAIPAVAAFNIIKNRIAQLVLEVGIVSEGLMSRFKDVGAPKK